MLLVRLLLSNYSIYTNIKLVAIILVNKSNNKSYTKSSSNSIDNSILDSNTSLKSSKLVLETAPTLLP